MKVVHEKLGEKYYLKKGTVVSCKDRYTSVVEMLDSKDKIKIDQAHLETVLPALGRNGVCGGGLGLTQKRGHTGIPPCTILLNGL